MKWLPSIKGQHEGATRRHNGPMRVRAVRPAELPVLRDIERAAGEVFRTVGMPEIADDEPLPLDVLAGYMLDGRAWVATTEAGDDPPVAYLIADIVDGNLHVEQVSVHPRRGRRGIGRLLLDHLAEHAAATDVPALTLTTFADVPWNAPYYVRCGFRVLADADLTPGLRAVREHEAAHGLDRWPRVCMRRDLGRLLPREPQ
jgi:ribosomal protein S18 acetylase RimI-like enzyme